MGLVPVSQVMGLSQIVGTHSEDEVASAINYVSDAIESYCERSFAGATETILVDPFYSHIKAMPAIAPMASYGSYPGYGVSFSAFGSPYVGTALLPNPPVTEVSLVEAFMPMASSGGGTGWVQLQNFMFATDGLVWDTSGMPGVQQNDSGPLPSWPQMPRSLQVTYSHGFALPGDDNPGGFDPLPDGIVSAVIRGVANVLANPANVAAIKVGDITTTFTQISGGISGPAGSLGRLGLDEVILGKYRLVHL